MPLPIKKSIERVPGGFMILPLLLGALLHTWFPHGAEFLGSFTGALAKGAMPILAVFFVCIGATIDLKTTPYILKKGGVLLTAKLATGLLVGLLASWVLGKDPIQSGWFAGLSVLAIVASMNDTNGGLFMALLGQFGKKEDAAAYSLMSLESGPFFTMITLGLTGLGDFPWQAMMGTILPLTAGIILGNWDREMRDFLSGAVPVLIPFFAFALGNTLDLASVWKAGVLGVLLGIAVILMSGLVLVVADRITGGSGLTGIAAATTAGNAVAVPAAIASIDPRYLPVAPSATLLVASSVIVTALLVPMITACWHHQLTGRQTSS